MRVGIRALIAAIFSFVCLQTGVAVAAGGPSSGVHTDPGSPAGKQYAIPIPSARRETSGDSGGSSSSAAPLFGVGVTAAGGVTRDASATSSADGAGTAAADGRGTAGTKSKARSGQYRGTSGGISSAGTSASDGKTQNGSTESSDVGATSWLPLLGGGALVLLIGGGGGFLLRRSL